MSIKIEHSGQGASFRVNGLLRTKDFYELEYNGKAGEVGLKNIINGQALVEPKHYSLWVNKADVPFASLLALEMVLIGHISTKTDFVATEENVVAELLVNAASPEMAVDGSTVPVSFSYTVPLLKKFICTRLIMFLETPTAMSSEKFGHLNALTNGLEIKTNGVTWGDNVKNNKELLTYMFDMTGVPLLGKETRTMAGRMSFSRFTDGAEGLTIYPGQKFEHIINDNLSTLSTFNMRVEGVLKDHWI